MRSPIGAVATSAIILGLATKVWACLWIHGTTINGHWDRREGEYPSLQQALEDDVAERKALFMRHHYQPQNPAAEANDAAVQTLLKGDAGKAVEMLREIETNQPGNYFTAANLGTALELSGNDEEALRWIKEGIRRNPESHMRTEWLHAKILETKIQLKTDPVWLESHTVTGIDLTRIGDSQYQIDTAQGRLAMPQVRNSLLEQLSVRMLLVKPKDAIVAQLLFELAHLESQQAFQEQAVEYLTLAETYGLSQLKTQLLRSKAARLIANAEKEKQLFDAIGYSPATLKAIGLISALGLLGLLVALRRRKRRGVEIS